MKESRIAADGGGALDLAVESKAKEPETPTSKLIDTKAKVSPLARSAHDVPASSRHAPPRPASAPAHLPPSSSATSAIPRRAAVPRPAGSVPKSTLLGISSQQPASTRGGAPPSSTAYLQGPSSTPAVDARLHVTPPTASVSVEPNPADGLVPLPERTQPQAIALEELARKAPVTEVESIEPPEAKVVPQERPSEQTRIFLPNLSNPALKPSAPPPALKPTAPPPDIEENTRMFASDLANPALKRSVPPPAMEEQTRIFASDLANPALKPSTAPPAAQEETRTYSADTIQKLLSKAEDAAPTSVEDASRALSHASAEDLFDDITRAYDADFQRQLQEREATSPGVRAMGGPRVIIQPEPKRPKRRYWWLGLLLPVVALGVVYRAPLAREAGQVIAWVSRGLDQTRGVPTQTAAMPTEITISIGVSPADASLLIDGERVTNPTLQQRRPDNLPHELVAEAPGFATLRRSVRFERDLTVVLGLAPLPTSAATSQPTSSGAEGTNLAETTKLRTPTSPVEPRAEKKAKSASKCDPPFTIDANGIKTFKPECL